jgi:hypothetical protein
MTAIIAPGSIGATGPLGGMLVVLLILAVVVPVALALFVFWIWMLISAVQNQGITEGEKIAWVLVIVFLHWLGALVYFFVGHPKRHSPLPNPPRP